jgi:hypothetical protein
LVIIHRYSRFELLRKQKEAASRKGVVGKTGRAMPTIPRARNKKPAITNNILETSILPPSIKNLFMLFITNLVLSDKYCYVKSGLWFVHIPAGSGKGVIMTGKMKTLFFLMLGPIALLFIGADPPGGGSGRTRELAIEVSGGASGTGPVYYSLTTGQRVMNPASQDWDIGFERPRLIYTNSGETAAALGSGGWGGVWHTEKTDFAGVSRTDAIRDALLYGPYNTDTVRWNKGAMLRPASSRRINVMTFTGYNNEAKNDGKTLSSAFSASFSYNKKQFYSARGMPPSYTLSGRVYIIRHGDGRGESKVQIRTYDSQSRDDTDRYTLVYQNF